MTGYYTAGILLCLIGEPHIYENCLAKRSSIAFPTNEMCVEAIAAQIEMLPSTLDMDKVEIVEIKCIEWVPEKPKDKDL